MQKRNIIVLSSILGFILIVSIFLICFFCIPRISYAYDSITDSYYVDIVYGDATSYSIKDTIHDKPVTKIKERAFMDHKNLKEITLGKNIKEIERLAFLNCKKLEKVDLSYVEEIGRNAFENCISLKRIELNLRDVLGGVFMGCSGLESVVLNNTLSIGSYAFGLTSIQEIIIPRTCSMVGNDAFYGCSNLKKIIVKSYKLLNDRYLNSLDIVEFQPN